MFLFCRDLSFNKIVQITDRVFAGLGSLERLYLNNNHIKNIEYYGFRNLHELKELYLHSNIINQLDLNVFNELFKIKHLYTRFVFLKLLLFIIILLIFRSFLTNQFNELNTICQHNFSNGIKITFSPIYCSRVDGFEGNKTIFYLKFIPTEFKTMESKKQSLKEEYENRTNFNLNGFIATTVSSTTAKPKIQIQNQRTYDKQFAKMNKIKSKKFFFIHNLNFNINQVHHPY